jgi:hypothetical protein
MIALYRGHLIAALAIIMAIIGLSLTLHLVLGPTPDGSSVGTIILTFLSYQAAIILGPVAYIFWVPQWEREEKITGRFPGDKEKQ